MSEPTTETGRRYNAAIAQLTGEPDLVARIEQEALAAREAEIRAAVEALPVVAVEVSRGAYDYDLVDGLIRDAVRAAIGSPAPAPRLDRERLARAMAKVWPVSFRGEFADEGSGSRRLLETYAGAIADAYEADSHD